MFQILLVRLRIYNEFILYEDIRNNKDGKVREELRILENIKENYKEP